MGLQPNTAWGCNQTHHGAATQHTIWLQPNTPWGGDHTHHRAANRLPQVRSSAKISSRSGDLAFVKLQRDVADLYARLDAAERGMSYEEPIEHSL